MKKLSHLYGVENPTATELVAHLSDVKEECRLAGEFVTHTLRIAAESAPGASRVDFIMAAIEVGFNGETAGIQFTNSRKLTYQMLVDDFPEFVGPFPVLMIGRR